ncbi:methyltransferase domain-containing protein [Candidatus Woesearchaeota archaeon]|nr:methyltransferase domain-containing protein [Candidatus Woesearchaeota archaeon]
MKLIFLLSGEHPKLAKAEAITITNGKYPKAHKNLLILTTNKIKNINRLAYTKKVYKFLFVSTLKNLEKDMAKFNWNSIYEKDFSLRIHNKKNLQEKELAGYIWDKVKKPKVNLTNPKTQIELFIHKKQVFCGLLINKINPEFEKRHPKIRPSMHPTTLKPRLARAMINLSGKNSGKLLDPFCGTGGILIEAGLLNYKITGYDLSHYLLQGCEKNLKHYKIKNYKLKHKDSTTKLEKTNLIVTDLPYGLHSSLFQKNNLKELYSNFLSRAQDSTDNAIIMFPNKVNIKTLIKKTKFKIRQIFKLRVHRSLTRNIVVLEK